MPRDTFGDDTVTEKVFLHMTPEQRARESIDALLEQNGWVVQDYQSINLGAARGIAVREVPLKSGRCDYLLKRITAKR